MKKIFCTCVLLIAICLSGCAITHDYKTAEGLSGAEKINVIENSSTREGFLNAMKEWLGDNGYKYSVLPDNSSSNKDGWVLVYDGKWSWDVTIYIAKAYIKAYKDGVLMGEATYSVNGNNWNANPKKWANAASVIKQMMAGLFGLSVE